ncbi:RHS repeat-associated protein [Chryseobacterium sp. CBTAP 102]|nr:RHS repeat-associated protein [Chryseobacterium sp. CBTAP 102]
MYDYGARMLMPDLGRWGAMDAMSEKYSAWSPYNYAINNPVMVIDPDGNDVINTGAGMTATGADAQFAFKAYVATMSTSTESSGGNIFTGFGGTLGEDPKPGFWGRVSNWWDRLFGRNKGADILTLTRGAEVSRAVEVGEPIRIAEFFSAIEVTSVAVGAATLGAVLTPVMMKDPEYNWARDLPLTVPTTVATDVPANESGNLYLYRNMRNVNGMPMVGEGLDKLGLRDRDVNLLSNSTMITPLFANGLSVTVGYGDVVPPNVPDFSRGKGTIFRISASSLISYGLAGLPVLNPDVPNYGQIRPAIPMNVGTFRALIQSTAPAWQPVK